MDVDVWYEPLRAAIPVIALNLRDEEIERIRRLYCVGTESWGSGSDRGRLRADEADVRRWRAATDTVVAAIESVQESYRANRPPVRPPHAIGGWLQHQWRWRIHRERSLREAAATLAAAEDAVRAAYRAYRDTAGDLTDAVLAHRERQDREQRERAVREQESRLAAVREGVGGAVWAYRIGDYGGHRQLLIWLPALESRDPEGDGVVHRERTVRQVQQAIEDERGVDPYLWVDWRPATTEAMQEWHSDPVDLSVSDRKVRPWTALTGVVVEPIVWRPGELDELHARRTGRGHGPSSSYWSPSFGGSF